VELGFLPDLAPHYLVLHNADGGKMEFIDVLATAIVQGFGFTIGMLLVFGLAYFNIKRKVQKTKLSVFDIFKLAKLKGNKNG